MRAFNGTASAFGTVFLFEAILSLASAAMALCIMEDRDAPSGAQLVPRK
jgi:hypothetical protein